MSNLQIKKKKTDLTKQEWNAIQQPLDYSTGWSNNKFEELYPNSKNPFKGTDKDIKNRRGGKMVSINLDKNKWQKIFKNK